MNALKTLRFDARLSRGDLAALSGVSYGTIRRIEQGKPFGAEIAGKLADALDEHFGDGRTVRPSDLLSPLEQPESGAAA